MVNPCGSMNLNYILKYGWIIFHCMYISLFVYLLGTLGFFPTFFVVVQLLSHVQLFVICGLQYTRLPCPSLSPGVCSSSCPLSRWCYLTISSSVALFSFCRQSFRGSGSFPVNWLNRWPKYWSSSFSISPSEECSGLIPFRIDWFDLLAVQETLKSILQHHNLKASVLWCSAFFMVQLSHPYMTTGKTIALTIQTFVGKVMSLLFNMQSRFVVAFLPRSKHLLISWLQSPSPVILEPKKIKSVSASTFSPSICHEVMGPHNMIFVFWMLNFKPVFSLSSFTLIKRLFSSSSLSAIRVVSSAYLSLLIFLLGILIPACNSSSPASHMMYCAYKLNKQGDNIHPSHTPFPIFNQSFVPCNVLLLPDLIENTSFSGDRQDGLVFPSL